MKSVLFFSYKGGVGRSLTLCNTAAALCRKGKRVGIVDFDVEAPSMYIQLGDTLPTNWTWDDYTPDILTLLRLDIDSLTPKDVEEATIQLTLPWPKGTCILLPCFGREPDLLKLEANWSDKIQNLKLILEMLQNSYDIEFLLIDSRTGYSQPGLVAACTSDHVVAVTRADIVSTFGMKKMLDAFRHRPMHSIYLFLTGIPEGIKKDDPKLVSFIKDMGEVKNIIYFPYIPAWYFSGEVIWEVAAANKELVNQYDLLSDMLLEK